MKIAMMIDSWFPIMGGGPIHVLELSKKLVLNHNCKIDIFTRVLKDETKKFDRNEMVSPTKDTTMILSFFSFSNVGKSS